MLPAWYLGPGTGRIIVEPYRPTDQDRLLPSLLATTFADYFNYWFSGRVDRRREPTIEVESNPYKLCTLPLARAPMAGGLAIALSVVVAFVVATAGAVRCRDAARLALLAAPLLALLGQIHFTIQYPDERFGPVKAHYLQFAGAPLFALFGGAVAWLWSRRRPVERAAAALALVAVACVAAYSIDARTGLLRPAGCSFPEERHPVALGESPPAPPVVSWPRA